MSARWYMRARGCCITHCLAQAKARFHQLFDDHYLPAVDRALEYWQELFDDHYSPAEYTGED